LRRFSEHAVDLGARGLGILDRVVQQRGGDRRIVEFEVGEDGGDFERVGEIRIARRTLLLAVRLHRIDVGAIEQVLVGVRIVLANTLDEVVLAHHRGRALAGRDGNRLSDDLTAAFKRGARTRLVLHSRQIGRRPCHPLSVCCAAATSESTSTGYHAYFAASRANVAIGSRNANGPALSRAVANGQTSKPAC
jgi:hypothetical protein